MINLLFLLLSLLQNEEVPLKPKEEFEVKLNYEFKQRSELSTGNNPTIDYSETLKDKERKNSGPLPYLTLNIKLIKLPNNEVKIKGVSNLGTTLLNKKVQEGDMVKMVLGYTADLKDRVSPHEYDLILLDSKKKEINRINIFVKKDGEFTVNGEVRGKF